MKKFLISIAALLLCIAASANQKEQIWPKGKMPDPQPNQIAAMRDVAQAPDFKPDKYRLPYIEWMDAPAQPNGGCMVLISGGGYNNLYDVNLIKLWNETFTSLGFQCVNLVYRTPRPEGLPIYQSAWEDGQRAIRKIRSEAAKRGFDPERIGAISMSAGSHLALLIATSSRTPAYEKIDALDTVSCHLNWAIVNAPAYVMSDAKRGRNTRDGYGVDVKISDVFKFDEKTCPMSLHHGGADPYSPTGSTQVYRQLRRMGIPAEVHLYPGKGHGAYGLERGVEFMRQMGFLGEPEPEVAVLDRFDSDSARAECVKEPLWPEGKMPDVQEGQNEPYLEWHFPKVLKTTAIQIIYSGGAYTRNSPESFEVMPVRRVLNDLGMTVVTMKYRSPRPKPESGLAKHTSAWQDLQRAIRVVRGKAAGYGLDPDRIGIMGSSAGGHLTLMGVTSSLHNSYLPIDDTDKLSCSVQWGIGIYPAYSLTDGLDGHNKFKGNRDEDILAPEFSFDLKTCPMLLIHGDADGYSAMASVKLWEKMRAMGVQSEVHTLATRKHCFQRTASPGTGSYNWIDRIVEYLRNGGYL